MRCRPRVVGRIAIMLLALAAPLYILGRWMAYQAMWKGSPPERGPFTVQGVRCGMGRDEASAHAEVLAMMVDGRGKAEVTLDDERRVAGIAGRSLESRGRCVLRAGDVLGKVRQVLGPADEEHHEGGMSTRGRWIYHDPRIEVDYDGDVVERIVLGESPRP
jgi:hypothetical protein